MSKSAEDVANNIHLLFFGLSCHSEEPCDDIALVAKEIQKFRDAAVNKAYERAAQHVEKTHKNCQPPLCEIANQIRAFKSPAPAKEG